MLEIKAAFEDLIVVCLKDDSLDAALGEDGSFVPRFDRIDRFNILLLLLTVGYRLSVQRRM